MRTAPTLDDVAKRAGVSTATVSRCVNAPERVHKDTRERVEAAIAALGYAPNFGARVMAAKRTFTIGAVIPTMENAIFARGLQAFQDVLRERGYTLIVASSAYRPDLEEEQIRKLIARGADGLLLIGEDRSDDVNDFLRERNVATVAAWTYPQTGRFPCVGFDNRKAMRALAAEVIALGHRRIGYISGVIDGNDRAQLRLSGLKDALAEAGVDWTAPPLIETPYDIDGGGDAFERLMATEAPPTAIMCGNDVLAVGALMRAREMKMRAPEDVSITGFDDLEIARIVEPPLATVHVPHREMGEEAARALIDLIEGRGDGAPVEVSTALRLRRSLGAPP
ncbi:MAG: LacI family DNA-binding transcriptional regulator [Pseudomonadota bacterium]